MLQHPRLAACYALLRDAAATLLGMVGVALGAPPAPRLATVVAMPRTRRRRLPRTAWR